MPHNLFRNDEQSHILRCVQNYAKSFKILGVRRIGIIPDSNFRNVRMMVEMNSPAVNSDKLLAVNQLLEYLLDGRVDIIAPTLLTKELQEKVVEIPL